MSAPLKISDELAATSLSPAATAFYDAINSARTDDDLNNLARAMWHGWGKGELTDDDAHFLGAAIDKRRPRGHRTAPGFARPIGAIAGRVGSHFRPRRPQRSPDRMKSRERRRTLGGSSSMPDNIRHYYTEGERSALAVVAGEVKRRGICDLPIAKIATVAGVCRTTVQNALDWARRLGHMTIQYRPVHGRRRMTNILRIMSREWRAWITKGPSLARYIGFKMFDPTKITDRKKARKEEAADKKSQELCHEPPRARPGGPAWAAT